MGAAIKVVWRRRTCRACCARPTRTTRPGRSASAGESWSGSSRAYKPCATTEGPGLAKIALASSALIVMVMTTYEEPVDRGLAASVSVGRGRGEPTGVTMILDEAMTEARPGRHVRMRLRQRLWMNASKVGR